MAGEAGAGASSVCSQSQLADWGWVRRGEEGCGGRGRSANKASQWSRPSPNERCASATNGMDEDDSASKVC